MRASTRMDSRISYPDYITMQRKYRKICDKMVAYLLKKSLYIKGGYTEARKGEV
jgi:hypothetical protein